MDYILLKINSRQNFLFYITQCAMCLTDLYRVLDPSGQCHVKYIKSFHNHDEIANIEQRNVGSVIF